MINRCSIERMQSVWRNGLILQLALLIFFIVFVSTAEQSSQLLHLIVYYAVIGVFICMLVLPIIAPLKIGRNVIVALFILILFNGLGSLILYLMYKKEMQKAANLKS